MAVQPGLAQNLEVGQGSRGPKEPPPPLGKLPQEGVGLPQEEEGPQSLLPGPLQEAGQGLGHGLPVLLQESLSQVDEAPGGLLPGPRPGGLEEGEGLAP